MITGVISIGIGYVYSLNKQYPFVLSIAACVLALVMALKLENVKEYHQKIKSAKQLSGEFIQNIRRGFQLIFTSRKLRWFVFYSAVISFALGCLIDGRGLNNALAAVAGILFVSGVILLADRK